MCVWASCWILFIIFKKNKKKNYWIAALVEIRPHFDVQRANALLSRDILLLILKSYLISSYHTAITFKYLIIDLKIYINSVTSALNICFPQKAIIIDIDFAVHCLLTLFVIKSNCRHMQSQYYDNFKQNIQMVEKAELESQFDQNLSQSNQSRFNKRLEFEFEYRIIVSIHIPTCFFRFF